MNLCRLSRPARSLVYEKSKTVMEHLSSYKSQMWCVRVKMWVQPIFLQHRIEEENAGSKKLLNLKRRNKCSPSLFPHVLCCLSPGSHHGESILMQHYWFILYNILSKKKKRWVDFWMNREPAFDDQKVWQCTYSHQKVYSTHLLVCLF